MTFRWLLAALLRAACCTSCSKHLKFSGRTLRIGFDKAPPYTRVGPDGAPKGLAFELISEAARRQHIRLQWVNQPGIVSADQMLASGAIDLWPVV